MVVWGKGGKVIEIPFIVGAGTGCVLEALSQMEQGGSISQLVQGRYIAPSKLVKPTQKILEKVQQRSIIANAARQQ